MSESEFVLALDLGMSRIAAATSRLAPSGEIEADSLVLGHRDGSIAAAAFITDDGDLLFGDAAEQRGFGRPDRLIRAFPRSVGDDVPLMAGDHRVTAEELCARLVRWVIGIAERREGNPPASVAITHPSTWTAHRVAALRRGLEDAGIDEVALLTSAAAAVQHEGQAIGEGDAVAVYDLGGSSFEATVLRKDAVGSTILGEPIVVPDVGGGLFDDAVLRHAIETAGIASRVRTQDADTLVALARLRRAAAAAKDALSFDGDATIPVTFPGRISSVRITRSELETMIDPALERTLDALERSIESAQRTPERIDLLLVIGGSAHIPLVAQRLSERFDRPLITAQDAAVALGAARGELLRLRERRSAETPPPAEVATPALTEERPRRPLLSALRPMLAGAVTRSPRTAAIAVAAVVVAGVAVSAAAGAAGLLAPAGDEGTVAAVASGSEGGTGFAPNDPGGSEHAQQSPPDAAPEAAPQTDAPARRADPSPAPRRPVRDTADDSPAPPNRQSPPRRGPQVAGPSPASPAPSTAAAPTTPSSPPADSSGSSAPPPADTPSDPPPPAEEPAVEPPAEQPPVNPAPVEPVEEDPPPEDAPPPPADPAPASPAEPA